MEDTRRKPYPGDLTDEQWALIQVVIPEPKAGGRGRWTCGRSSTRCCT
jgi:transposase